MKINFDYSPTFLGGVNSASDYYHREFNRLSERYAAVLEELRYAGRVTDEERLVKTFSFDAIDSNDFDNPYFLRRAYAKITGYIDQNKSGSWRFSRMESEIVSHLDYDDCPGGYTKIYRVYAYIANEKTIKDTDRYKELYRETLKVYEDLLYAKSRFIEAVKKM